MKNRIYFYSGTGNSLRMAENIAENLTDCEVIAIKENMEMEIPSGYDRIGFVFPIYFQGLPLILVDFLSRARIAPHSTTYFFAAATYGRMQGNGINREIRSSCGSHYERYPEKTKKQAPFL